MNSKKKTPIQDGTSEKLNTAVETTTNPDQVKITKGLDQARQEDAEKVFSPLIESIEDLPKGASMELVSKSIDKTIKQVEDMAEGDPINRIFERIQKADTVADKAAALLESVGDLLSGFLSIASMGQGQDIAEKLISYENIDYTTYAQQELGGSVDPTPSLQQALVNNPYPEETVLYQIIQKIKNAGTVTKRLARTSAYTSALLTFNGKKNDESFSCKDYETMSGKEKIQDIVQPGDLLVLGSGAGGRENNVLRKRSLGNEHIVVVGTGGDLYQSTMNKGKNNDEGAGFEKKSMRDELDHDRAPCRISIVRPPASVNREAMFARADDLVAQHKENPSQAGYSKTDAAAALMLGKNDASGTKMNCAKFTGSCLEAGGYKLPEDSGDPSTYFDEDGFSIEFFGTYGK